MSVSPTALFWTAAVIACFPLTAAFVPIVNLVGGIVAAVAAIVILFSDSVIPNNYVWGALVIFFVTCLPPVRLFGRSMAIGLLGRDPNGRDVNVGDALIGAVVGLWYNSGWLQFAAVNNGSWLIYLNWFLASIGLWSFFGLFAVRSLMRLRR